MKNKILLLSALFLFVLVNENLKISNSWASVQTTGSGVQDTTQAQGTGQTVLEQLDESKPKVEWSLTGGKIVWSAIILTIVFLLIKYLTRILQTLAERWPNFRLTIKGLIPVVRVLGWTFTILIIIQGVLRPPIETLIAITASAGIAIGFASQDILKNIFGGIMILFDRPFQVGDKIEVGKYYGEVTQIGLRTVRIVTPDDSLVSIPNSDLVNQSVPNSNSVESNCQVVAEFYLPPGVDMHEARKIAKRAAAVSRYCYLNKPVTVIFKNDIQQGRSLVKMRLKAYVLDIRFEFAFASEMTEIVIKEFIKHQIITAEELSLYKPVHINQ